MSGEHVRLGWLRWVGLGMVALAAAALSFESLRALAIVCGTPVALAWLLPIAVDAGAVVALSLWMSRTVSGRARRFARTVSLSAIALSVGGNATQHALAAYGVAPPWWAVVAIGAAPAAMLAAVAELVALVVQRPADALAEPTATPTAEPVVAEPAADTPPAEHQDATTVHQALDEAHQPGATSSGEGGDDLASRARALVNAGETEGSPVGRKTLARELDVSEHQARQLLRQLNEERRPALHAVGGG